MMLRFFLALTSIRRSLVLSLITLLLLSGVHSRVQAAAGDLDPTFGNGGIVKTDFGAFDIANAVATHNDGRIVVVGRTSGPGQIADFAVVSYDKNGNPDVTFGNGGKITTDFFGSSDDANAVAIQSDGKIVVAGSAPRVGQFNNFAMVRYNPDGSLDNSFGSGGRVSTDFFASDDKANEMVIQPDGKIILGGFATLPFVGEAFAVARYNSDGSLDASFGSDGKWTLPFDSPFTQITGIALVGNDRILAAGYTGNSTTVVVRINMDGSLDTSFGDGGKTVTEFQGRASSLAVQTDGKAVVGVSINTGFRLLRYNDNGSLDITFGENGQVFTRFGNSSELRAVLIQNDGKILAAGKSGRDLVNDFAMARYNIDGSLDPTFGQGGQVITDLGSSEEAHGAAFQEGGKVVLAGFAFSISPFSDFAVARYQLTSFDLCIQDESNSNLLQINTTTGDYQFTNCNGFAIGGAGILTTRGCTVTLQDTRFDRRVLARIDTCQNRATASIQVFSQGVTVTISDRNTTNNSCSCNQ